MAPAENDQPQLEEFRWTAFRYVRGELSEAEQLEFEEVLADDQSAREVLASVVTLDEAVSLAFREEGRTRVQPSGRRPFRWAAAALLTSALALLAALLVFAPERSPDGNADEALAERETDVEGDAEADAIVTRWLDRAELLATEPGDDADEPLDSLSDESFSDEEESDFVVPDWMVAALESDVESPDAPEMMEN